MRLEKFYPAIQKLYGADAANQISRYETLIHQFEANFKHTEWLLFSTPGRTEIGGNHTDHNHGRVLAASVNLDSIAVAAENDRNQITLYSHGYGQPFQVDLNDLQVNEKEKGTTTALIRGIAARLRALNYHIGGFDACLHSTVLPGSGLSSSASVEVLIATICNALFNQNRIPAEELALISQYAENHYFGKPCGLMDQMTCAVGGIISIDFKDPRKPVVKKVPFDFQRAGYKLVIVDTGGNHADLTEDYASVPAEMKAVAAALGKNVCRELNMAEVWSRLPELRKQAGDRAVLRCLHFLQENERVLAQVKALEAGNFGDFLRLVQASGDSSFKWLQNIFSTKNVHEQGITLALALSQSYCDEIQDGACRVHGGGFAGTIQVFLPESHVDDYRRRMESVFGAGKVMVLEIRPRGTVCLANLHRGKAI